jgi:hypothetical protein
MKKGDVFSHSNTTTEAPEKSEAVANGSEDEVSGFGSWLLWYALTNSRCYTKIEVVVVRPRQK